MSRLNRELEAEGSRGSKQSSLAEIQGRIVATKEAISLLRYTAENQFQRRNQALEDFDQAKECAERAIKCFKKAKMTLDRIQAAGERIEVHMCDRIDVLRGLEQQEASKFLEIEQEIKQNILKVFFAGCNSSRCFDLNDPAVVLNIARCLIEPNSCAEIAVAAKVREAALSSDLLVFYECKYPHVRVGVPWENSITYYLALSMLVVKCYFKHRRSAKDSPKYLEDAKAVLSFNGDLKLGDYKERYGLRFWRLLKAHSVGDRPPTIKELSDVNATRHKYTCRGIKKILSDVGIVEETFEEALRLFVADSVSMRATSAHTFERAPSVPMAAFAPEGIYPALEATRPPFALPLPSAPPPPSAQSSSFSGDTDLSSAFKSW